MQGVAREELRRYLDTLLEVSRFHDYCPNGLQVEGRATLRSIVCGVTASQALIDAAIERQSDAILVHHGWFWKGEDGRLTGFRKRRMAALLAHDISLFAYHLPLDAHPELGNNAQLAKLFGWTVDGHFGEQDLGCTAVLPAPTFSGALLDQASQLLGRPAMLVGAREHPVTRVAWCSGGAQDWFEAAINAGADLFMSGEISEQTTHLARESGVAYLAAGHHATERYGVQALGAHVARELGLNVEFVDIDNPV
jgi:dinuclear metal center YbgI/SA1388 family protein